MGGSIDTTLKVIITEGNDLTYDILIGNSVLAMVGGKVDLLNLQFEYVPHLQTMWTHGTTQIPHLTQVNQFIPVMFAIM